VTSAEKVPLVWWEEEEEGLLCVLVVVVVVVLCSLFCPKKMPPKIKI
jgi:hypothetical protein